MNFFRQFLFGKQEQSKEFKKLGFNSVECANYLRYIAIEEFGLILNMTQVQKLLYMAYGVTLAINESQLLDEVPQAWPFGPIFPLVHKFTKFQYTPSKPTIELPNETKELFRKLVYLFGRVDPMELSEWSRHPKWAMHQTNPWIKANPQGDTNRWGREMSNVDIYKWFKELEVADLLRKVESPIKKK